MPQALPEMEGLWTDSLQKIHSVTDILSGASYYEKRPMISRVNLEEKAPLWLIVSLLLSLVLHLSFVGVAQLISRPRAKPVSEILNFPDVEIQVLSDIETLQETASEAPDKASFISSRDLKADEETSPELRNHDIVQAPSGVRGEKLETFSLSDSEKLALNDPLLGSTLPNQPLPPSRGYEARLKRGQELKVNALRHDTSGFTTRIKRKLHVTWNPRNTVQADMYRYRQVTVTIGITLNQKGELVDLRVVEPSFFPQYDEEALRTIRQSVPFPNPPDYLVQDDGLVYLPWSFHLYMQNFGIANVE